MGGHLPEKTEYEPTRETAEELVCPNKSAFRANIIKRWYRLLVAQGRVLKKA